MGIQGKLCRRSEKTEETGGLLAEARGEVYKGQEETGTVQMWRGMVGGREAGWLSVGSTWGEQTQGACAQACDGVHKSLDPLTPGGGGVPWPQGLQPDKDTRSFGLCQKATTCEWRKRPPSCSWESLILRQVLEGELLK